MLFPTCIAGHSTASIEQQRLGRQVWNDIMLWMKDEMGWPMASQAEYDQIHYCLVVDFGQDSPR